MSKRMYHPCHKLSVPSAKLFWCRHCMQMFEDAISRWKHSKKCHASPGYKPKDQDARVVQLYVKPDKVSYTSNITPGQTVYHKPHVKKTSTDLKCVICGTKFYSLYDMRNHVKEPCQKSDYSVASTQFEDIENENNTDSFSSLKIRRVEAKKSDYSVASTQFEDIENEKDTDSFSSLKIRRVEAEDAEKAGAETALSVLAEASKHVESLSHNSEVILEQVIEEVPQVIEEFVPVSGDQFAWYQFVDKAKVEEKTPVEPEYKEVVVAYPRPQVKPELGTIVVSLQSEDGNQLLQNDIALETIQECVKETAATLPVGQIIQIQLENTDKYHHFVVGLQGVIWPLEESTLRTVTQQQGEQLESTVLNPSNSGTPVFVKKGPESVLNSSLSPTNTQLFTNKFENNIINNINIINFELPKGPVVGPQGINLEQFVVTSEQAVEQFIPNCNQTVTATSNTIQIIPKQEQGTASDQNHLNIQPTSFIDQSVVGGQVVSTNSIKQELHTTLAQPCRKPESLVEALLRGSVVITQPTVAQDQTEVAIVEIADGHLQVLSDQDLHSYAQNVRTGLETGTGAQLL